MILGTLLINQSFKVIKDTARGSQYYDDEIKYSSATDYTVIDL